MEKYYTLKETSEILNVKVRTLRLWIDKGKLVAKKYNNGLTSKLYVSQSEIDRLIGEMQ